MKKILMVLAKENFRDVEYITPKAFFEQSEIEVKTVSSLKESKGKFGFKVSNDLTFDDNFESLLDFDGIVFVGGFGCLDYLNNELVRHLALSYRDSNKLIAAICSAPKLLLAYGILDGKKCTGNDFDKNFATVAAEHGADYDEDIVPVVVDGKIITANGPKASEEFALKIIENL